MWCVSVSCVVVFAEHVEGAVLGSVFSFSPLDGLCVVRGCLRSGAGTGVVTRNDACRRVERSEECWGGVCGVRGLFSCWLMGV